MTRMTRIIIANIIREIRAIRSAYHKVQCSNLKVHSIKIRVIRVIRS